MKKTIPWAKTWVMALMIVFSFNSFGQTTIDIVQNGDFENWTDGNPDNWMGSTTNIASSNILEYTVSAHTGSSSCQLIRPGGTHGRFTTEAFSILADTEYTVTYFARGKGEIRNAFYRAGNYSSYTSYTVLDTDDWTEIVYTFEYATAVNDVEVIFSVRNTDDVRDHIQIDNVSITYQLAEGVVATPTFSPAGGDFFADVDVTIETVTENATIFYSTVANDGPWTEYTAPVTVTETTTLYAYATAADLNDSDVASAVFNFPAVIEVADIATLRAGLTDGTLYQLTSEAILTFDVQDNRNQKYIQDNSGAIVIDDNSGNITTSYQLYDGITGIIGSLSNFNNMLQFVPATDAGAATSQNNVVEPLILTLDQLDETYMAYLVTIENVVIDPGADTDFTGGTNYDITDDSGTGILRTNYGNLDYVGQPIPTVAQNITGIIHQRNADSRLVPRNLADFEEYQEPLPATVVEIIQASEDHETLAAAVVAADLADVLSGDGPFTVFAPTDDAFAALPAGLLDGLTVEELTDILLYHVVSALALAEDLSDGQVITTLLEEDVVVTITNGTVFINDAEVIIADLLAENGVVHVIDAVLVPEIEDPVDRDLMTFFFFGNDLPNNAPLETIDATFDLVGSSMIEFHSALDGYPFDSSHPNWRDASMERRNAPTPINYLPEANNDIAFDAANMRGVQIKQPFTGDGGENTMFFYVPTTGYENIVFAFAAMDEDAGATALLIDYRVAAEGDWVSDGLNSSYPLLTDTYQLYTLNFSEIEEVNDNPDFAIRVRFEVADGAANDGDRVTFNNVSLHGVELEVEPAFARVQIIHNSADPAAASVDIFANGVAIHEGVAFRSATEFEDVPAGVEFTIDIAPAGAGVDASVGSFVVTFEADETYVVVANGLLEDDDNGNGNGNGDKEITTAFSLFVFDEAREEAMDAANTDILVFHGATDAPEVSVWVMGGTEQLFAFEYGEFAGYLSVPAADLVLEVRTADGETVVAAYEAPLATLNLDGEAITVLASGFLAPEDGQAAFALVVATADGGVLTPLPVYEEEATFYTLFDQPYFDGGNAYASALGDDIDLEVADNFSGVDEEIIEVAFYGITLKFDNGVQEQTPAAVEPFIVRFYEYEEVFIEGLEAEITGTYQLALQDDADHWNWGGGSIVSVFVNGDIVIENAIMVSGDPNPKYYSFEANAGDEISTVYAPGSWASENYYAILDPDGTIIAEEGGTWDNPGTSTPGSIAPGQIGSIEPDWDNPVVTQNIDANVSIVGPVWNNQYTLYKFTATLDSPVDMEEGWFSAQIDSENGSGTWFLWMNSDQGDGVSWQREPDDKKEVVTRDNPSRRYLSSVVGKGGAKDLISNDVAFELWGGELPPPAQTFAVTFTVEDEDGVAIDNAMISLGLFVNAAGDYVFNVEADTYNYIVVAEGFEEAIGSITVVDEDVDIGIVLIEIIPAYCAGGPTAIVDSNVENVFLEGANDTTIDHDGCPGVTGVEDLTDQVVEVLQGQTYTLSVKFGTCGGNYAGAGSVWIDWDQSFSFEPGEAVLESTGNPGTTWADPVVVQFTVPNDAPLGTTAMRVMQREGGSLPLDPCGTFSWGSVMDFGINVLEGVFYTVTFDVNVANAVVTLNGVANPEGDYVFEDIAPGTYEYTVSAEGFQTVEGQIIVVDDAITVPVELFETFAITFNVTDEDNEALGNVELTIKDDEDEIIETLVTDVDGGATIVLIAGDYTYTAELVGFTTLSDIAFTVSEDAAIDVQMTVAVPILAVHPETVDFGVVLLGAESVPVTLTLANEGGGTLTITNVELTDPDDQFILTDDNDYTDGIALETLEEIMVSAIFAPTMAGDLTATITISYNDGDDKTMDVTLTGNGFDPTVAEFPWLETFEGTGEVFPPLGWVSINADGAGTQWETTTLQNHTPDGGRSVRHNWASAAAGMQDGWLITPAVEVPVDAENMRLVFWSYNVFPSDYGKNSVLISTGSSNPADDDFVEVWSPEAVTASWVRTVLDLDEYAGETIIIAFRYEGTFAHVWYLDDVAIEETPTYAVTFEVTGMNGDLTASVDDVLIGSGDQVLEGANVVFTAIPDAGYRVLEWTVDGEVVEDFTGETWILNNLMADVDVTVEFEEIPPFHMVTFTVTDFDNTPLVGASVAITGLTSVNLLTDDQGVASSELEIGDYTAVISKEGYVEETEIFSVVDQALTFDFQLDDLVVTPFGLMVETEGLPQGDAHFSWNNVMGDTYFFDSFEDGTFDAWHEFIQGPGTPGDVGMAYWHTADSEAAPDGTKIARADWGYDIDTWLISPLMAVDANTSITFNWASSYFWSVDPNPHAQLMIKVSEDGGSTWDELWNWQEIGEWTNWVWYETTVDLDAYAGSSVHVAIQLLGNDNAETLLDAITIGSPRGKAGTIALSQPIESAFDLRSAPNGLKLNKAFLGYNVFLNDVEVAAGVADTDYMFTNLPEGTHTAGVQSVYSSGVSPIETIDFVIAFTADTYALTLEANPVDGGTVSGAGDYEEGEVVTVTADAADGYEFVNWTHGTDLVSTNAEFDFTMPAEATTLVANFEEIPITDVATLAELRTLPADGTVYRYTGEAVIVAMDGFRNRKFIQDETAALLIDDEPGVITTEYDLYDVITDVVGQLNIWNNLVRIQPTENTAPATENTPVDPVAFNIDDITSADQSKLAVLHDVHFVNVPDGAVFANGTNYTISDGTNEMVFRTDFWNIDYIGEEIPDGPLNITGVLGQFQDDFQITARFAADIEEYVAPEMFDVTFNVDMRSADNFDPENDVVYITGSLFGWAEPGDQPELQTLSRVDESMIWSTTLSLEADSYMYKYFINAGWEGGEWDGDPNREITVAEDMAVNDFWGSLVPLFELTLDSSPADGGTVSGEGFYAEGAEAALTATPAEGFVFVNWTDNGTVVSNDASFTYTMPAADVTLTANFDIVDFVNEVAGLEINLFPNPARENFTITSSSTIRSVVIADITGKIVHNDVINDTQTRIYNHFEAGLYIVTIHTDEGVIVRRLQIQ